MSDKNYKLVSVTSEVQIPVPLGLTPEQEAEIVARFLAEHSPEDLEAEHRELKALIERNDLLDFSEVVEGIVRELHGHGDGT